MDFKGPGSRKVSIVAAEQPDEYLIAAAWEIRAAAEARGLVIPPYAGSIATEAAANTDRYAAEREMLLGQLDIAHTAHLATAKALGMRSEYAPASRDVLGHEFKTWLTESKLSYIAEQMAAGRTPYVVATPNVAVDYFTLDVAADKFSQGQPLSVSFYSEIIDQCTPEELSGTDPKNGNKVYFNVVFGEADPGLYGDVQASKAGLARLKRNYPFLEAPSQLKSLAYYFTLRAARGGTLEGPDVGGLTYMRNYALKPKKYHGRLEVSESTLNQGGRLFVIGGDVRMERDGRALVG